MSFGMLKAGVNVLAGIDCEEACRETYEKNVEGAKFILQDVFNLKEKDLQRELQLTRNDDDLILIGCSPCQFWTVINTDKSKSKESKNLLIEFRRFVEYFMPGFVVVENVPGVLRKKEESGLASFLSWLEENGYKVHFDVHNVNEYGVPQNRNRFTLIASRISDKEISPLKYKRGKRSVKDVLGEDNGFPKVPAGHVDKTEFLHTVCNLEDLSKERLKLVKKNGGDRLGFAKNPKLQLKCFVGKDDSFKDTFGRMWWDKPAPTITTKFFSISNGRFAHPEEDRAISLREGATLQSFPKTFKFYGSSIASIARIIGNAVPPQYAKRIGLAIIKSSHGTIQN